MMYRMRGLCFFLIAIVLGLVPLPYVSAAPEGSLPGKHFYFVQMSDTHWGREDNIERTKTAVEMINALPMPITCVVHTGDITDKRMDDESAVSGGLKVLQRLKAPMHFVPGNRDIKWNHYAATKDAFVHHFGGLITQNEYDGVVFIMVYTEPLARSFSAENYQPINELKSILHQANGKPIIIFHHSPSVEDFYNNSMHKGWNSDIRDAWASLLNSYNVKAIIAGHFHRDELHWVGNIPLYVSSSVSGNWGRQATFRIYEYKDGKIGYRTQYIE